jgi:hypothetical protein
VRISAWLLAYLARPHTAFSTSVADFQDSFTSLFRYSQPQSLVDLCSFLPASVVTTQHSNCPLPLTFYMPWQNHWPLAKSLEAQLRIRYKKRHMSLLHAGNLQAHNTWTGSSTTRLVCHPCNLDMGMHAQTDFGRGRLSPDPGRCLNPRFPSNISSLHTEIFIPFLRKTSRRHILART